MAHAASRLHADVFCRVVDNYGDIGVCWRLARRLGHDLGWQVRLWVDDLHSFARLAPALDPTCVGQWLGEIEVRRWTETLEPDITAGDMVIEAFACDPPAAFVAAMRARPTPPVWINLEYLSAEDWVAGFHKQVSLRGDGLRKAFFFPGFSAKTGGLLREPGVLATRETVQASRASRADALIALGLLQSATAVGHAERRLATLFCYPGADLPALFAALAGSGPWTIAVPEGVAPHAQAVAQAQASPIAIERFDWLSPPDYDRLLCSADLNIVRGEDSFVRAHWAARPMLWHIYPQDDDAHIPKLDAWLAASGFPPQAAHAMRAFNTPGAGLAPALAEALRAPHWQSWQDQAACWTAELAAMSDLADNLASYYANIAESR